MSLAQTKTYNHTLVFLSVQTLDSIVIVLSCLGGHRLEEPIDFSPSRLRAHLRDSSPLSRLPATLGGETLGSCLHIRRAFLAELVVMNGASDVPPICAHRVRQASIIAVFLAARTHSQFVPNIVFASRAHAAPSECAAPIR